MASTLGTIPLENDTLKSVLYAVNIMLQTINEVPLEDESELDEVLEARIAREVLEETKKAVLADGWDFNTDDNYSFPPDIYGYINIPQNVLDLSSPTGDLIMRDWRLYSKRNQSAIFEEPQSINVVWEQSFNSLTHPIRYFITVRAARIFQARTIGDPDLYSFTQQDEEDAYISARRSEQRTGAYNMLTTGLYGTTNVIG